MIDGAVAGQEVADVIFHVFLNFGREVAQAQIALLVVPGNDFRAAAFGMFDDPGLDFLIGGAGGDEGFEGIVVEAGELEPDLVERAIGVVFALPTGEDGAALVHRACGQDVAGESFARTARVNDVAHDKQD